MSTLEPPPNRVEKFTFQWKEWLNKLYQFIQSHTGGTTPTSPATGTSWNAHGNTATGDGTAANPLKITDSSFLIDGDTGEYPSDATHTLGNETKLLWCAEKSALRAGIVASNAWDESNIGTPSFAVGTSSLASTANALAMGNGAIASATINPIAIGAGSQATGFTVNPLAIGNSCIASQTAATAIGSVAHATGLNSMALGVTVEASGSNAVAIGNNVDATGTASMVVGIGGSGANQMINADNNTMWIGVDTTNGDPTLILQNQSCGILQQTPLSTLDISGSVGFKYDILTGSDAGEDTLSDEYVVLVDMQNVTSSSTYTVNLPQLGASTIDRRIYYIKMVSLSGSWPVTDANLDIVPNGADQIENIDSGSANAGTLKTPEGTGVTLTTSGINRGTTLTLIADNTNGGWWVI